MPLSSLLKASAHRVRDTIRGRYHLAILFVTRDLLMLGQIHYRIVVVMTGALLEQGNSADLSCAPRLSSTNAPLSCAAPAESDVVIRERAFPSWEIRRHRHVTERSPICGE
jgi:ABC-type microcin C transport system duplicated ATPase subunit YejF